MTPAQGERCRAWARRRHVEGEETDRRGRKGGAVRAAGLGQREPHPLHLGAETKGFLGREEGRGAPAEGTADR